MRFVAIAAVLLAFPAFCAWLKQGRGYRLWAYALVGLLPFTINAWQLDASLISWPGWPGPAKGAVITMLDSLALAIIVTHRGQRRLMPMLGLLLLYLAAVSLSVAFSNMPRASEFYVFQLIRMIVLAVAVARIASDVQAMRWLAFGLSVGITYQAVVTIGQKAGGAMQAAGTMGHQNLLGYMTYFALLPLIAMLLSGERSRLAPLGIASALIVIALGASRGTIMFSVLGSGILFVLSLARRPTGRKWRVLGLACLGLAMVAPIAYKNLENRFEVQGTQSGAGEERLAFERAAKAIWRDYPMGVGANMYIIIGNTKGYSERAGVNWSSGMATNVHNTYLLVAAETGWFGLISFIALFVASILMGLRIAFTHRRDPRGEVALGFTAAIMAASAHNFYEWISVLYQGQYMFAIALGVIGGLTRERRATGTPTEKLAARASSVEDPSGLHSQAVDGAERILG